LITPDEKLIEVNELFIESHEILIAREGNPMGKGSTFDRTR